MEALILTLPTLILLAIPVLLLVFIGMEAAEMLSKIEGRKKEKVKVKAAVEEQNGLFIR